MIVYRAIKIDDTNNLNEIGIYWTSDWNKAYPYGYKGQIDDYYIYTANITQDYIDVAATAKKADESFSYEREIVLNKGIEITITRIEHVKLYAPMQTNNGWTYKKEILLTNTNYKIKT